MSDTENIRTLVLRVLGEIAPEASLGTLITTAPFQEQLDLDSMDFLNVVSGLSEATGVDIPERDYPKVATLDGCVAYLASRLAGAVVPAEA
jgi:acyl carrier protein